MTGEERATLITVLRTLARTSPLIFEEHTAGVLMRRLNEKGTIVIKTNEMWSALYETGLDILVKPVLPYGFRKAWREAAVQALDELLTDNPELNQDYTAIQIRTMVADRAGIDVALLTGPVMGCIRQALLYRRRRRSGTSLSKWSCVGCGAGPARSYSRLGSYCSRQCYQVNRTRRSEVMPSLAALPGIPEEQS